MDIQLRQYKSENYDFLKEMLYEAVFWRNISERPSFEEGLRFPGVSNALESWSQRPGDEAVIAYVESIPVGAAWYRYWDENNNTRGYINPDIPVIVIGVHENWRHKGIGYKLLEGLILRAAEAGIEKISLCVSKDNHAQHLYRKLGFEEYEDIGDSWTMIRFLSKKSQSI